MLVVLMLRSFEHKTRVATATVAALAGLGVAALASGRSADDGTDAAAAPPTGRPLTQTIVVRRVIHRVRHVTVTRSRRASHVAGTIAATGTVRAVPVSAPAPKRRAVFAAPVTRRPSQPVTSTSGTRAKGGHDEQDDHGDEHHGDVSSGHRDSGRSDHGDERTKIAHGDD